jgi:hypothetical protein
VGISKTIKLLERFIREGTKLKQIKSKKNKCIKNKTNQKLSDKNNIEKRETKKTTRRRQIKRSRKNIKTQKTASKKTNHKKKRKLKNRNVTSQSQEKGLTQEREQTEQEQSERKLELLQMFKKYDEESTSKGTFRKLWAAIREKIISPLKNFILSAVNLVTTSPIFLLTTKVIIFPIVKFALGFGLSLISQTLFFSIELPNDSFQTLYRGSLMGLIRNSIQQTGESSTTLAEKAKEQSSGLIAKWGGKILNFKEKHPQLSKLINITRLIITIGIQIAIGLALCLAVPLLIFKIWNLCFELLTCTLLKTNILPALTKFAQKFPVLTKAIIFVVSSSLQLIIGAVTGAWMLALINIGINFALLLYNIEKEAKIFSSLFKKIKKGIFGDADKKRLEKIIEMEDMSAESFQ